VRADRSAIGIGPTDAPEGHFRVRILHLKNARQGKGLGGFGEEEMLGHLDTYRL
jgi:hypothetical protein